MPYSEQDFEAMQYNPVLMRAYFWRVAMGMKRRSLVTKRDVIERGVQSPVPNFVGTYLEDGRRRDWADVEECVSAIILSHIDILVRTCIERPRICEACRKAANER